MAIKNCGLESLEEDVLPPAIHTIHTSGRDASRLQNRLVDPVGPRVDP